ncbi:MAG: vWA domain-containing protein, partial [Pirellulales bacterium]
MVAASKLREWWQTRAGIEDSLLDPGAYGWLASLALHLSALFALAAATLLLPNERREVLLAARDVEAEPVPVLDAFQFAPEKTEEVGAMSDGGAGAALPQSLVEAPDAELAYQVAAITPVGDVQVLNINQTLLAGPNATENLLITGTGSSGAVGAAGAVDRITQEILLSLDERPTLVVWLFDQSGSLKAQRESIAKRFDRVYDELGVIEASGNPTFERHDDKPLLTAVAAFGSSVQLLTKSPTDDVAAIKTAVREVADDTSGHENVFQSVHFLADKFRHYRLRSPRRNVMIVIFTDEAGDDVQELDATIESCRKYAMPVYVIGVPAPFGREDAFIRYVDPDPKFDQSEQWLPVHQGPESLLPERLKLNFAGVRQYDERIDSGFGPYGLCRLTSETGGIYFTVHPNRKVGAEVASWETAAYASHLTTFFDERVMRMYQPDYVTVDQYYKLLGQNRACASLVQAAQLSWTTP